MNDYIPITQESAAFGGLLGTWWRKPPYSVRRQVYEPYRGEGFATEKIEAEILSPDRKPTEWERFQLAGIEPPLDAVPTGKEGEWYAPVEEPELLNALLDVAQDKRKPEEFADRFGLLGYNRLVPSENRCGGDPLVWFLAQAQTVHTAARLIELLNEIRENHRAQASLAEYLEEGIFVQPHALGGRVAIIPFPRTRRNPVLVASGILRSLLNANLGQTGRRLDESLRAVFTFRSLIEVIYWQLADLMGKHSIHRCLDCGRIFTTSNVRIRFCPPTEGQKISPCKSKWNVREFRKKKRPRRKKR